jgi:hypothetical protein
MHRDAHCSCSVARQSNSNARDNQRATAISMILNYQLHRPLTAVAAAVSARNVATASNFRRSACMAPAMIRSASA